MKEYMQYVKEDDSGNIIEKRMVEVNVRVRCEFCQELIATINKYTIHLPLEGWMFQSPDPHHDWPRPFNDGQLWEDMRCPHCSNRPFLVDDPEKVVMLLLESHEHFKVLPRVAASVVEEEIPLEKDAVALVEPIPEPVTSAGDLHSETISATPDTDSGPPFSSMADGGEEGGGPEPTDLPPAPQQEIEPPNVKYGKPTFRSVAVGRRKK